MRAKSPSANPSLGSTLAIVVAVQSACISTTVVNIGTKSSLERQLIGELEPLSDEEMLAASVRAQGQVGAGSLDELQARAVAARRRQLFNKDEIDELKQRGCIGEARSAELVARSCAADTETTHRRERLLNEENADRLAILDWAIAADPGLRPSDRPEVVKVYRRLLAEAAATGTWVEADDGTWAERQ